MVEQAIFLAGSLGFIWLSRQAFSKPYTHGFPRFFAFESLLGLVVLNASRWFEQPFSLRQILSWVLLALSLILASLAFRALRVYGAPDRSIQDDNRIAMEKTTRLVTQGPYQVIRHPMYASLLYLAWGVFLKQVNLLSGLLVFITCLSLFLTAVYEEQENLRIFGDEYTSYMQHRKRFIPFVF